ncbi:hypothetical protein [Pandoraea apista]|uniref:Uncharacterized protein n=1 Tax=Pandoraea apista TaxID=93218 RepID=A0ABX9ZKH5_9BURK|nr:hypothetical protein [Pandoraea apista]AJE97168.1 hypothetical protein SG18_01405 [Pandoraea apista]AKH71123.1 hypothetical protein XM39_01405 [Pandoraea apista]AKI63394.1 hypothetical protein AA956_18725 [Pandoraea apista]ALS67499.1 hypothetical protein AT395_23455 [Pandoraea apista]AVF41768.1 hypothetical protein AL486_20265 [Pandoraea apista]
MTATSTDLHPTDGTADSADAIHEDRLWRDDGWTAKVVKNEEDDGWAVAMYRDGESEPALVGPWTMGRDKKNPKPLDVNAFHTLVKTATEVLRRHEQQLRAQLHKRVSVDGPDGDIDVTLDIVPDDYDPYAMLSAIDRFGETLAAVKVPPTFKLSRNSARAWVENDFQRPQ